MVSGRFLPILLLTLACVAVGGCAPNGFKSHYTPYPTKTAPLPCPMEPTVAAIQSPPDEKLAAEMWSRGFDMVGESAFWSTADINVKDAVEQARLVGACMVLVFAKNAGTVTNFLPVFNYAPPESYQTQSSGRFGNIRYEGKSTITQQGPGVTTTNFIPYQQTKTEYSATYWTKAKSLRAGILAQQLPEEVRTRLKRNTGVYILSVMEGSPAFLANVVPGDILVKVDGNEINTTNDFIKFPDLVRGKPSYEVVVLRDGQEVARTFNAD